MSTPPPHLMQGIQLVQAGQKAEALAYLRHAARTEAIGTEGWLWLAAATDDFEEYRYCVEMALQLDPYHPTAQRMRDEMARQGRPIGPAPSEPESYLAGQQARYPSEGEALRHSTRWRRALVALLVLLALAAFVAALYVVATTGFVQDALDELLMSSATTVQIGTSPTFRFRVRVPDTWLPADEESDEWQARRATLEDEFPPAPGQLSVWEQADEPFSAVTRDPVYGGVAPNIRLVETDPAALERDGMVAALTLQEILPLPAAQEGEELTVCNRMRTLAQTAQADGSAASVQDNELIEARLIERDPPEDCVFYIHRRATNRLPQQITFPLSPEQAPDAMRAVSIMVPVGAERYAVWWLTFADEAASAYSDTLNRIVESLEYRPAD